MAQMRARVENPTLISIPAKSVGWTRIFSGYSAGWKGAHASLHRREGAHTYGSLVNLSAKELDKLDQYEMAYTKEPIDVEIYENGSWTRTECKAYIAMNYKWAGPPSEQYLTAIHVMLREQFADMGAAVTHSIPVYGVDDDGTNESKEKSTWVHPGYKNLSIPALVVEANTRIEKKWKMPTAIHEIERKLALLGVESTREFVQWLNDEFTADQEALLSTCSVEGDQVVIHEEFRDLFRSILTDSCPVDER
jgi:hypothetical protein